jgi:hypothetical protein
MVCLLTIPVFPSILSRLEAGSLRPFVPFYPSVSLLTAEVGKVDDLFYVGTEQGGARKRFCLFI